MKADIITIGDEILIGQTVDTNSAWMGGFLEKNGVHVGEISTISDKKDHITSSLSKSLEHSDIVLITGGLGPTKDDVTKQTLCDYFDDEMVLSQVVLTDIKAYFELRNRMVNEYTELQALVPSKCKVIRNRKGTAPGMWFEHNGKVIVSMPGVPYEMKGIMNDHVFTKLLALKGEGSVVINRTVRTHGMGESFLAEVIKSWENNLLKDDLKLAYLPSPGIVKLRISIIGKDKASSKEKLNYYVSELIKLIPDQIYGYGNASMEGVVGELLKENNRTLSTAESCTGGNVSKMLTSISGSSSFFNGSIISYTNQSKSELLNVNEKNIENSKTQTNL